CFAVKFDAYLHGLSFFVFASPLGSSCVVGIDLVQKDRTAQRSYQTEQKDFLFHNCFSRTSTDRASNHRHATVHRESVTHDVTGSWTAQPQHNGRDFLWPTSASDGNALRSFGIHLLVSFEDIVTDLVIDQAGIH